MFKKILIGLLAVAIGIALARSGYELGKRLAQRGATSTTHETAG